MQAQMQLQQSFGNSLQLSNGTYGQAPQCRGQSNSSWASIVAILAQNITMQTQR